MSRRWIWRILKIVVVAAIVGGVVYRVRFAPVSVTQHQVEQGEIVAEVMGTGTLEAHVKATVSSKISGRISEVLVDQGDTVQEGQLLLRLDDEELRQQVAIAEAGRDVAVVAIERLKSDKARAVAVARRAKSHFDRVQILVKSSATTEEELENSTEGLAIADAGLTRADAAITEGQKALIAAEKTLEYQRARLTDTVVKAPFDGLIIRRQREPGDVVVPGSSILTLIATDILWISAWVDETEMAKLKEEQPARVVFRSEPDRSILGNVVRLGREADRETREFIVDVLVHELPQNWAVGQRAEVYIETDRKAAVVILPAKYVSGSSDAPGIFVNQDGQAKWKPLTLGLRSRDEMEVIEGLKPGETVILPTSPKNSLRDGQRIVTP